MIEFFICYILSFILFPYEEVQEWLDTKWGDIREHLASIPHRLCLILTGYFYPFGFAELSLLSGVYWIMTDGIMNLMKNRNFFAVSNQSGNPFEKWNVVKLSLIVIGIILIIVKGI